MENWQVLPIKFTERLTTIIPANKLKNVLNSFSVEKPLTLRINTLKTDILFVKEQLAAAKITFNEVPWYNQALLLPTSKKQEITELEIYKNGQVFFQNLSSMIPSLILEPKPAERILDMAAAPGNKTTQIAQMMRNTGEIIANDISKNRLYKLRSILTQLAVSNVKITQIPGEFLWKKYPNYFDKVLVDAPCTMEGRFRTQDDSSYKDWTPKKIKVLSYLQKRMLHAAFYATKPGGIIVYSTCTLSPEENEEVINWLLLSEKQHVQLEAIDKKLPNDGSLTEWKKEIFHPDIKKTIRILPSRKMEGFFVAKIKRIS